MYGIQRTYALLSLPQGKSVPFSSCFHIVLVVSKSPEFNPIENTFAEVKRIFNKARLEALANDQAFDIKKNIKKAFKVITPEYVKACAARSLRLL